MLTCTQKPVTFEADRKFTLHLASTSDFLLSALYCSDLVTRGGPRMHSPGRFWIRPTWRAFRKKHRFAPTWRTSATEMPPCDGPEIPLAPHGTWLISSCCFRVYQSLVHLVVTWMRTWWSQAATWMSTWRSHSAAHDWCKAHGIVSPTKSTSRFALTPFTRRRMRHANSPSWASACWWRTQAAAKVARTTTRSLPRLQNFVLQFAPQNMRFALRDCSQTCPGPCRSYGAGCRFGRKFWIDLARFKV